MIIVVYYYLTSKTNMLPIKIEATFGLLRPRETLGSLKFPIAQSVLTTRMVKWQSAAKKHSIWQGVGKVSTDLPGTLLTKKLVLLKMVAVSTKNSLEMSTLILSEKVKMKNFSILF